MHDINHLLESLLHLIERKKDAAFTLYHGTSTSALRGIMQHGLRSDLGSRVFPGMSDQRQTVGIGGTLGSTYLTGDEGVAWKYALVASSNNNSYPMMVAVKVAARKHADDDEVMTYSNTALEKTFRPYYGVKRQDAMSKAAHDYMSNAAFRDDAKAAHANHFANESGARKLQPEAKARLRQLSDDLLDAIMGQLSAVQIVGGLGAKQYFESRRYVLKKIAKLLGDGSESWTDAPIKFKGRNRIVGILVYPYPPNYYPSKGVDVDEVYRNYSGEDYPWPSYLGSFPNTISIRDVKSTSAGKYI